VTRTWAVDTAFARVQLRFKRFPSLHTLLLCIAARAFALPVEVDSSQGNTALHVPFTHCIHRQVVAAHRPPPCRRPRFYILFRQWQRAAASAFHFLVLQFCMAQQAASPPIPSPQASALASSAHVPAAHRIALAAPCVPLATATHIVFGIACVVTAVCMCAGTRSVLPPKQQCTGHIMLPSTASRAPGSHSSCPPTLYPCPCPQRAKHFRASDSTPRVRLYYKWQARVHAWGSGRRGAEWAGAGAGECGK